MHGRVFLLHCCSLLACWGAMMLYEHFNPTMGSKRASSVVLKCSSAYDRPAHLARPVPVQLHTSTLIPVKLYYVVQLLTAAR